MRLCEILSTERILVDTDGSAVGDKHAALAILAGLLSPALGATEAEVERLLYERERLQSTGIGEGVAIPHTSLENASRQVAALVICPRGVDFEAIDGESVKIIFGVVGPRRSTGEHLKTLARISRLLRNDSTRDRLIAAASAADAYELIEAQDQSPG